MIDFSYLGQKGKISVWEGGLFRNVNIPMYDSEIEGNIKSLMGRGKNATFFGTKKWCHLL